MDVCGEIIALEKRSCNNLLLLVDNELSIVYYVPCGKKLLHNILKNGGEKDG